MNLIKKVGFFFELPLQERLEILRSLYRDTPHPDEGKIVRYLESGAVYGAIPGIEEDILVRPPQIIGPMHIQTDEVWAWPQTLTYYIRRYHIALPTEFVAHMRLNDWKCPQQIDTNGLMLEGEVSMG